jgi:excisionase family DNA binding protein
MTASASEIIGSTRISVVYRESAGVEPQRSGPGRGRARAAWRGGILDLVISIRGGSRADALRWCADLAGVPLNDKPLSAEDRARRVSAKLQCARSTVRKLIADGELRASRISSRTIRASEADLQGYLDGRANMSASAAASARITEAAQ